MKKVKAYQCSICCNLFEDELDKTFCSAGLYPGCGEPDECRNNFKVLEQYKNEVQYFKR